MESKDLHVLFIPFMAHGHMIPMIDTTRAFAERGVTVSVVTTPVNASYFQKTIDRAARNGHLIKLHIVPFPCSDAGLPDGCENTDHITSPAMLPSFWRAIGMLKSPMERIVDEHRPNCIVSDMCFPWTADIALKHGIPRLGFCVSNFFSIVVWESIKRYRPHENVDSDFEKFVVTGLPHRIEMTRSQLPDFLRTQNNFTDFTDRIDKANEMRPSSTKKELSKSNKRKLDKKLHFYSKVRDTVAVLGAKKAIGKKKRLRSRQKKLQAYDLSTLSEFLPAVSDASQRLPLHEKKLKLNHKSRQKLVEKESNQLRAVLNHPVFQSDPLSAVHQHLASTQPLPVSSQEKRSGKTDKKKKRKHSKVSSGGNLAMSLHLFGVSS